MAATSAGTIFGDVFCNNENTLQQGQLRPRMGEQASLRKHTRPLTLRTFAPFLRADETPRKK